MGQFTIRQHEEILERKINKVVARTDLNDLNDGSSIKQVLAASSREDDELYYQMWNLQRIFDIDTAIGNDLDERAKDYNPDVISRTGKQKAIGAVVFSRTGTTGTVTIPVGTGVQVPADGARGPISFTTTEEGTISAGNQDSNQCDIVANEAGADGVVDPETITGFVSKPSGVDTVSNPAGTSGGLDTESDDAFRTRLKNFVLGLARCHVDGLRSAVLDVEHAASGKRVVFAHVVEDLVNLGNVTVYIDDGNGTAQSTVAVATWTTILASAVGGETVTFFPNKPLQDLTYQIRVNTVLQVEGVDYTLNLANGQINWLPGSYPSGLTAADAVDGGWTYYDGLIAEAQKVVDGDPADRVNYPGYRAAGVTVRVLSPNIDYQTIVANITVLQDYSQTAVASSVVAAIQSYINSLGIGEDVILNEIRERAMAVGGMYDIQVTQPTENVVILDTQLARTNTGYMTIT